MYRILVVGLILLLGLLAVYFYIQASTSPETIVVWYNPFSWWRRRHPSPDRRPLGPGGQEWPHPPAPGPLGPGGQEWPRPPTQNPLGPGGQEWPHAPTPGPLGPGGEQQHMLGPGGIQKHKLYESFNGQDLAPYA